MTRRILAAIVAVAALAVTAFGVPLAFAVRQVERDNELSTLRRIAAERAAEVPTRLQGAADQIDLPRVDSEDVILAVYDAGGSRVSGKGPSRADPVVTTALRGRLAQYTDAHQISVGWPLTVNEQTYGAIRAALPVSRVENRVHGDWLLMAGLALGVVGIAAGLAWRQARRLARPVAELADAAARLGHGDFTVTVPRNGIAELDRAGQALSATAGRLGALLARERTFSADASHQLRTPLTAMRLSLESASITGTDAGAAVRQALAEVERLEATVDGLLRLAREERSSRQPLDVEPVLNLAATTWNGRVADQNRRLSVEIEPQLPRANMSSEALRQILDVLLANAATHGAGMVRIAARRTPGGVSIEVSDEGPGVEGDLDRVFERGEGTGHGIGLALARSLAAAEGGLLTLRAPGPSPRFRLLIPEATPPLTPRLSTEVLPVINPRPTPDGDALS